MCIRDSDEVVDDSKFVLISNKLIVNDPVTKKYEGLPKGVYAQVQFGTVRKEHTDQKGIYREGVAFSGGNSPPVSFKKIARMVGLININRVRKPSGKGRFIGNRGDVSEGIMAAAIAARFVYKTKSITENDIKDIISELRNQKWKSYTSLINSKSITDANFESRTGHILSLIHI